MPGRVMISRWVTTAGWVTTMTVPPASWPISCSTAIAMVTIIMVAGNTAVWLSLGVLAWLLAVAQILRLAPALAGGNATRSLIAFALTLVLSETALTLALAVTTAYAAIMSGVLKDDRARRVTAAAYVLAGIVAAVSGTERRALLAPRGARRVALAEVFRVAGDKHVLNIVGVQIFADDPVHIG